MAKDAVNPDWAPFVDELQAFMTWREMSAPTLAAALGMDDEKAAVRVRQWRAGNGRPQFKQLPQIVQALHMNAESRADYEKWKDTRDPALEARRGDGIADWTYLVRKMGLVVETEDVARAADLAITVGKLESRKQLITDDLAAHGLNAGLSNLVREVVGTEEWAIAAWPAVEGPQLALSDGTTLDISLHVADRVDLRRVDGAVIGKDQVWDRFEDALKAARAVPARPVEQRWITQDEVVDVEQRNAVVSSWSIRRLGAPHASSIASPYPNLASVCVTSLTVGSWANDIADHLSRLLGYGFTSTRDAATELHGQRNDASYGEARAHMHDSMLRGAMQKRVWGHFSAAPAGLGQLLGDPAVPSVFTVYLRQPVRDLKKETVRLQNRDEERKRLSGAAPDFDAEQTLEYLKRARAQVDEQIPDPLPSNLIVVELDESAGGGERDPKYLECFTVAASVLATWFSTGRLERNLVESYWSDIERKRSDLLTEGERHTLTLVNYFRNAEKGRI